MCDEGLATIRVPNMPLKHRRSPFQGRTMASRWRAGFVILISLVPLLSGAVPAQDLPTVAATLEMVRFAREEAASDRAIAERQLERAERYRGLEINALRGAERATDPVSRESWLNSAREHAMSALRLEKQSRRLRAKADTADARADQLEAALDRRRPAP